MRFTPGSCGPKPTLQSRLTGGESKKLGENWRKMMGSSINMTINFYLHEQDSYNVAQSGERGGGWVDLEARDEKRVKRRKETFLRARLGLFPEGIFGNNCFFFLAWSSETLLEAAAGHMGSLSSPPIASLKETINDWGMLTRGIVSTQRKEA